MGGEELRGGVLMIGSLFWQVDKDKKGDQIRKNWREQFLEIDSVVDVEVPIRYGRLSHKNKPTECYTMVIDKSLAKENYGKAKVVPFINGAIDISGLVELTHEISKAEGDGEFFIKGDRYPWCVCGILINPSLEKTKANAILDVWGQKLKENTLSYEKFIENPDIFSMDSNGQLKIIWPEGLDHLDVLIATSTKPEKYSIIQPDEVVRLLYNRPYFHPNRANGIRTFQDDGILMVEKSRINKLIADYADVYSRFEVLQKGDFSALPGGDQKTGVIAEYYAKCYIENQFKVNANYASSGSSWDIDFLLNDKKIRVQVKGVSAHSKTRTIAPLRLKDQKGNTSFDLLYLIDLDLNFKPVGLFINDYKTVNRRVTKVTQGRLGLQGTKMIDTLKKRGGSRCYDFTENKVAELLKALGD